MDESAPPAGASAGRFRADRGQQPQQHYPQQQQPHPHPPHPQQQQQQVPSSASLASPSALSSPGAAAGTAPPSASPRPAAASPFQPPAQHRLYASPSGRTPFEVGSGNAATIPLLPSARASSTANGSTRGPALAPGGLGTGSDAGPWGDGAAGGACLPPALGSGQGGSGQLRPLFEALAADGAGLGPGSPWPPRPSDAGGAMPPGKPPASPPTAARPPPGGRVFSQAPRHEEHAEVAARVILSPKETYDHIVATGVAKTHLSLSKQVTQGVMAGFYISFSFMLCMTVGGQIHDIQKGPNPGLYYFLLGSVGFPLGLTIIMVVGADLFTSSCMYMMTAWIEGRVATYYVIKNWLLSWWCNLAGCLIMAQLTVWAGFFAGHKSEFPIELAMKKTGSPFGATVVKAIIANWLVNLAVWMANSARDVTGKAVGVYLPVSAFVTLGTEHCIANQYQLSLAKMLGSNMSLHTIIGSNLVPATIGNIIGGAFFVGTLYAGTYGTLYERMWLRTVQLYVWAVPRRTRECLAATQQAAYDRLLGWVDWDYLTTPPADVMAQAPSRGITGSIVETPRRLATAALAALQKPPMSPFEKQRSKNTLGSDVV